MLDPEFLVCGPGTLTGMRAFATRPGELIRVSVWDLDSGTRLACAEATATEARVEVLFDPPVTLRVGQHAKMVATSADGTDTRDIVRTDGSGPPINLSLSSLDANGE